MKDNLKPVRRKRKKKRNEVKPANPNDFVFTDSEIETTLIEFMKHEFNVLLIGLHGGGKTTVIEAIAAKLGLRLGCFSIPTTDVYADLTGIPVPNRDEGVIEFFYNQILDEYDIIFFDEFNRPPHPKAMGAVMELVQKKSINGRKFNRLKAVWAAINPPESGYVVDDIDPAIIDRFHAFVELPWVYHRKFYIDKFGKAVGDALLLWTNHLSKSKRSTVSPRRLEYIGQVAVKSGGNEKLIKKTLPPNTLDKADIATLVSKLQHAINDTNDGKTEREDKLDGMLRRQRASSNTNRILNELENI